jgi:cyclopropane fatty-acyl-phospholipid synthase-like methyltransferase
MNKSHSHHPPSIPAEEYTREYFETCCQGFDEYKTSHGDVLPLRLSIPLKLASIKPGMNVLDIGCGRGELVINCARLGAKAWGLDYAKEALLLAGEAFSDEKFKAYKNLMALQQSNANQLPFANESIDFVFMLDIVEHLSSEELKSTFNEVWRILHPDGKLIVHTMPNLWYYRFGYPVYRFIQRIRGQQLPIDPRSRWNYAHVHVNEQDPRKLQSAMDVCKFNARIWLYSTESYQYEHNSLVRWSMGFLSRIYPFRWIFCNDIFAIGTKRCA